jgi:hypothetical protein
MLLGLLCVGLLLLTSTIHIVHIHGNGDTHGDCALCITAQVALAATGCSAIILLPHAVTSVIAADREEIALRFYIPFALFNRPPPDPSFMR